MSAVPFQLKCSWNIFLLSLSSCFFFKFLDAHDIVVTFYSMHRRMWQYYRRVASRKYSSLIHYDLYIFFTHNQKSCEHSVPFSIAYYVYLVQSFYLFQFMYVSEENMLRSHLHITFYIEKSILSTGTSQRSCIIDSMDAYVKNYVPCTNIICKSI